MIKILLARPYHLFLLIAIVLFALSFFHLRGSINFHYYDTYYIINGSPLYHLLAAFFLFFWLIYLFIYPSLYCNALIWVHLILTIISIIAIFLYANYELVNAENFNSYLLLGKILTGALFAIHLLYPVNLIAGRIKYAKTEETKKGNHH